MKHSYPYFLLYAVLFSATVAAQTSHHGVSFRTSVSNMASVDVTLSETDLITTITRKTPAYGVAMRYNYFFDDRFSLYAEYGFTAVSTDLTFRGEGLRNGVRESRFLASLITQQSVTHAEVGGSYSVRLRNRLALVGEAGVQLVTVGRGGGSGRQSSFDVRTMEIFTSAEYSYDENPDSSQGVALRLAPGLRYQLSDHFYLALRADVVLSEERLLENGLVELETNLTPAPVSGNFERLYRAVGLGLMVTYRF